MAQDLVFVPPTPQQLDEIESSQGVADAAEQAAQIGMAYAESIAPRLTGEYAESFEVVTEAGEVRLVNNSDHAVYVEFVDGYHTLAQGADRIEGV